ncbi:MAG: peptide-methionine (S)-S-oxide reductase MsrA [Gemmatimonadota bacterium]
MSAAPKSTAIFAGGCYWGVESVYLHVLGVKSVTSGFALGEGEAGPAPGSADHDEIAEAVRVVYDSTQVSYDQLLQIFFSVAHDPTQVGHQGPDVGHRYRSALYTLTDGQKQAAEAFMAKLAESKAFPKPITTVVFPLRKFVEAPAEQQDFAARHPNEPYIQINDVPKIEALKREFSSLYREK